MNYFEHHIGDYDKNTSHLTACEDGIYSRMIRRYMDKERPLDVDTKEIKRIVRARNREEKSAVDAILKEFFHFENDGWHHKTCDETIAAYQAGEPEREVKKANEDNRLKRHRAERADLFKALTDAGQHAPWNIGMAELRELVKRLPETLLPPLPATAPATLATATQTPIPNTHTPKEVNHHPDDSTEVGAAQQPRGSPSRIGEICILLRGLSVHTSPQALSQHTWPADPGATDELLRTAVAEAKESNPNARVHVNYLKPIIERLLNPPKAKPGKQREDSSWAQSDQGIVAKAQELGIRMLHRHTHYDIKVMCFDEIRKRKGGLPK